jgi:transposase-like protein
MTKRQEREAIYVKRQFDTEIIVLCVRWYITYRLSYRDLVAMMAERGVIISHTTIMRWVIRYVTEFEKRWNRFARSIGSSWRVDETYISIKGKWHYLVMFQNSSGVEGPRDRIVTDRIVTVDVVRISHAGNAITLAS